MQQEAIVVEHELRSRVLRLRRHPSSQALLQALITVWSLLRHVMVSITAAVVYHLLLIHTKVRQFKQFFQRTLIGATQQRPHLTVPRIQAAAPSNLLYHPFLLPPICPSHFGKLTVVLDLDETLICTYKAEAVPAWLKDDQSANFFTVQYGKSGAPGSRVHVYERPGLRDFLHSLAEFSELVLFTAGLSSYAMPLVNYLDPEGIIFSGMLFREATCSSQSREHVKDLARLGRDPGRIVIVDNNPYSFLLQPANGVPCLPFHGDTKDGQLLQVILPLLRSLSEAPDIRPVLSTKFQMSQWFRSKGLAPPQDDF